MLNELPKTGAAVTRRLAKKNPMQVLVDLIDGEPTADANRLFRQWWPIVQDDDDMLEAIARHAFTNFLSSLERDRRKPPRKRTPAQVAAHVAAEKKAVEVLTKRLGTVRLMDLVMPNGKKLRECTFAECGKFGSWFKVLATKGKPSEIVGRVMSEDDLRKLR